MDRINSLLLFHCWFYVIICLAISIAHFKTILSLKCNRVTAVAEAGTLNGAACLLFCSHYPSM